jgi:hypothetical protein
VKNTAQKVVVTFPDGSKVTVPTGDVPASLGATDLRVFVVERPAGAAGEVKKVEKFDAAGKSLGLVGTIASVTLVPASGHDTAPGRRSVPLAAEQATRLGGNPVIGRRAVDADR